MRGRILQLKSCFEHDEKFIAEQDDIYFLEKAHDAISNIGSVQSTPNQILKLLENCKSAFSLMINKSISAETIELCFEQYIKYLSGCSIYFLSEAFDVVIKTKKFFPSIAEILEAYDEVDTETYNLFNSCRFYLIPRAKVSIIPRTKEYLKAIIGKKTEDKTKIECEYEKFMQYHYEKISTDAQVDRYKQIKAEKEINQQP